MKKKFVLVLAILALTGNAFAAQLEGKFIKDDAITAAKIAADAVGSSEIAADAVGTSEIATDGVGAAEIVADAVGSAEIAVDAVGSSEIAASAVDSAELAANAVGGAKFRLETDTYLRARNNAGSADVSLFKLNASDILQFFAFPITPSSAPTTDYQVSNKKYVDDSVAAVSPKTWLSESLTLGAGDITNQYVDSSQDCVIASVQVSVSGALGYVTDDFTLSSVASKTRVTFVATTGYGTGSGQALVAGDKVKLQCQY